MEYGPPRPTLSYDIAQTFYLDKDFFKGAEEIGLTKIHLFFRTKPDRINNVSGLQEPGVTLYLCAVDKNDRPDATKLINLGFARCEWGAIVASMDASTPAIFNFPEPIEVATGYSYAMLIKYDGNEEYVLWTSKEGDILIGTNAKTAGPAGKYVGKYYEYESDGGDGILKPLNNTDLKFEIYAAKYSGFSNVSVTNTTTGQTNVVMYANVSVTTASDRYEFFIYNDIDSENIARIQSGEYVFQNSAFVTGTLSIAANSSTVTGAGGVNFNTLYDLTAGVEQYLIVFVDDTDEKYVVRRIMNIKSNTELIVDRPCNYTNTAARFIRSPVGILDLKDRSRSFGKKKDFLVLRSSNANSTLRFTNNTVESVNIVSGGTTYTNGDILTVVAATATGAINAIANVTTNTTGGITAFSFSNNGAGINTAPTYAIANSTGGTSTGSGVDLTFGIGQSLLSRRRNVRFANAVLINYDFHGSRWAGDITKTAGTKHEIKQSWKYYHTSNTYDINVHNDDNDILLKKLEKRNLPTKQSPLAISWSYQVLTSGANTSNGNGIGIEINIESNTWFTVPKIIDNSLYIYKNIINNDYTNEHTRYGNAQSKHVTTKINFADGKFAEDLIVYLRAHRPANTDLKIYAKMHHSDDPESFDDKDWTLLECKDGANSYSSETNYDDLREYTYGLYAHPNVSIIDAGTATTTLDSVNVVGSGSDFATNFAVSDVVKIWSPLFPNNYMISVVNNVVNSTSLNIKHPVSNNNIVGSGFKIAKVGYKNQVFSYALNDGVSRYYNSAMSEFDTFDTFALKIVFLSPDAAIVPSVDDIRAVGVSA
jgi:hypothetical protein